MAAIDQLLSQLRSDGSVESEGRFTLDREQARAKMQKFQLADPRRYVLELVQAAVLRGATAIHFDIDADDMRMRFDGEPFTAAEFDDLYGSLFGEGDSRKLRSVRQLALALNAALGMAPKHIHVRSGVNELRMAPGRPDEIFAHSRADARTEIHVRQRLKLRVFVDFLLNLTGRLGEEQHLRQRCVYSSVPVFLDGTQISGGLAHGHPGLHSLGISGADYRGFLHGVDRLAACELHLVKDGVWIDTKELTRAGTQLVAVIEGDNLRKDVSQARIVENAALERIEAAIVHARWQLWTLARDARQGEARKSIESVIRGQLLEGSSRAELLDDERCRALAAELTWPDCRELSKRTSLAELATRAAAGELLRFAGRTFTDLLYEPPAVPLLEDASDGVRLRRVLGVELFAADDLLAREQRRAAARKGWLARKAEPVLPGRNGYAVRTGFRSSYEGKAIWGEVAVDMHLYTSPDIEAPLHLFVHKQGRLLGRHELDIRLANLWIAVEAEFEANDEYSGAVPDLVYIHALLRALASFADPLAELIARAPDEWSRGRARGLAKQWLAAMVDREAQIALLTRAGADVRNDFFVPNLVPGLDSSSLLSVDLPLAKLAELPLFNTLDDAGLSLAGVREQLRGQGQVTYVERALDDPRLREPGVAVLGTGDRKLLRALIGEARLVVWDPGAKRRELAFWDQEPGDIAAGRAELVRMLIEEGGLADPGPWMTDLDGPTRGYLVLVEPDPEQTPSGVELMIVHEGRPLCEVTIPGLLRGACALIEHPGLRPSAGWDDVIRDASWDEVVAAIEAGCERLVASLAALVPSLPEPRAELVRERLLAVAGEWPPAWERLRGEAVLTLLDGEHLSPNAAASLASSHGALAYVSRDVARDDVEVVSGAPILRVSEDELEALRKLLDVRYEDASDRVRHREVYRLLRHRPELREAKLEPERMLVSVALEQDGQTGEFGLPRAREQASLELRLGVAGREAGELEDSNGFFVAVDAVVLDDELPLDEHGQIKWRSKRIRDLTRHIRRRIPELIQALCQRWPELRDEPRDQAWRVLLQYLEAEAEAGPERRSARDEAIAAASSIAWVREVRGRRMSLAELRRETGKRPFEVLSKARFADLRVDDLVLDRPIAIVDEHERACLAAHGEVRVLDEVWDDELAALRRLADAPELASPDVEAVALAYRKAMVAGGLEAELWIPRAVSPLDDPDGQLQLLFVRSHRQVGEGTVAPALPCRGIVRGEGLGSLGGKIELDDAQAASLERQALILYNDLAHKLASERLRGADHARGLEYLAWTANLIEDHVDYSHGKHVDALRQQLARLVAPSLRDAVGRRIWPERARDRDQERERERDPEVELAPAPAPTAPTSTNTAAEPARSQAPIQTAEQRLLAAVYAELRWARARHAAVDRLLLDWSRLVSLDSRELALLDGHELHINRGHPIVARLLTQAAHDPIDLHFVIAALYSLLNYEAEEISDDDEREFVAQLAETLALEARARSS